MKFRVIIDQEENGVFVARCPSLPDIIAKGKTRWDAARYMKEALKPHLEKKVKNKDRLPPVITATSKGRGSITPSGRVCVGFDGSQAFTITPDATFRIVDVKIDGKSVGAVRRYTFNEVNCDREIQAIFR